MAQDQIPKNQIKSRNTIEQREHEDDAAARRILNVDKDGVPYDYTYRQPVDAEISIVDPVINVELDPDDDAVAISSHPNPIFDEDSDTITTSAFEEIFSYTSADSRTRIIRLDCTVSTPSLFQLKINGSVKKELWSSSTDRNVVFQFDEHRPLASGDILTIEAKVERFIHASYDTFVSMEGYIRE